MPNQTPISPKAPVSSSAEKSAQLRQAALEYHQFPTPGKIAISATKQLVNQHDLALAYSPGVAAPCEEIVKDPNNAFKYTSRGNLVAVITNGTAVLGLGDIGPLAAKPVMEGKGVLFKKFAGIDVFDIEINEKHDLDKLVDIIASMEPTFGGINLEDIKAPDCFYVERKLRERMKIPVFHDDQHGTAIVVGAAILNGLKVVGKDPRKVKLVTSGAGAAALACLGFLGHRPSRPGLRGARGIDGRRQGRIRAAHQRPDLARRHCRRRYLPRPLRWWRSQGRYGQDHGGQAAGLCTGQSDTRDPARRSACGAR
jgi:malate dehydrogenase (oxaloacetate-decarboxylating)(NADP+)